MKQPSPTLLDPLAIQHAESLGLHARFIVEGYMAGEHKSPFRGFAVEFTQHREYSPGDDTRHLDWKVLGRTDRYYLKQYEQETNYVAHILLDGSASMKYGSGSITKLHYGKMMAAVLTYLILNQRDAVSVGIFDTTVRSHLPRTGSLASIINIMNILASFNPASQTSIGAVLHELAGQIKRKGIVIIISDLFDDEEKILKGIQHLRFGGSEVIVFHVMDPFELDFPFMGLIEFEGLENQPKILTRPREIRKSYLQQLHAFQTKLGEGCERNNVHYTLVNTGHALQEILGAYLSFRLKTTK